MKFKCWCECFLFQEQAFHSLTNSKYSIIEEQISEWLDSNNHEEFAEPILKEVLESITDQKPGISLLSDNNQNNYHKDIQEYLKGKMKKGKTFNRKQMKELLMRFLLKSTSPNAEFDILLFLKVSKDCVIKMRTNKTNFWLRLELKEC